MSLGIIHNEAADVAHRNLMRSNYAMNDSLRRLSSGLRVESARDDAASLAIGSRLKTEASALEVVSVNASQGISMLQIGEGAMARVTDMLVRMKALSAQAGSAHLSNVERGMLDTEYQALLAEIDRVSADTQFNGSQLVNGKLIVSRAANLAVAGIVDIAIGGDISSGNWTIDYDEGASLFAATAAGYTLTGGIDADMVSSAALTSGTSVKLTTTTAGADEYVIIALNSSFAISSSHSGAVTTTGSANTSFSYKVGTGANPNEDTVSISVKGINAAALGLASSNVATASLADSASATISLAIDVVANARAQVGAVQNRLDVTRSNIVTMKNNIESAQSSYLDLDVAQEMAKFTGLQILVQAGVSMVAQATQVKQSLLALFQ